MHYPISVSCRRKPIKFCSSDEDFVTVVYKQLLSYDTANTLKIGDFFALTWSTFADPVTIKEQYSVTRYIHNEYLMLLFSLTLHAQQILFHCEPVTTIK